MDSRAARVSAPSASDDDGPVAERSSRCRAPCVDLRRFAHNPRGAEFKSGNATTRPETSLALSPRTPDVMCGWRAMGCVAARAFKLLSPAVTTAVTSFFAIRRGFQKVRFQSSKETRKNQGSRTQGDSDPVEPSRTAQLGWTIWAPSKFTSPKKNEDGG